MHNLFILYLYIERFLSKEVERLRPIISNKDLPRGIIHGDIFADNTLFEGEKLVAIIDFEVFTFQSLVNEKRKCVLVRNRMYVNIIDPLLVDIAVTISGCCYPNNKLDKKLVDAFLNAYNSIRPLSDLEKKLLDDFVFYANLSVAFWRFRFAKQKGDSLGNFKLETRTKD